MARTNNGIKLTEDPKIPQSMWNKVAFLKLQKKEKEKLTAHVSKESQSDQLYWVQVVLSTLIATFGLLQNSVAVIIGAMLIAPLLRPIQGVAFSLTTGKANKFFSAGKLLIWTIIISISIAALFAWIIPLRVETTEILARTSPNILDLFIAIASAIIAILALSYKKLSESIAGVAMAASLMPPLAVVGIEISLMNFSAAGGAFFLFMTNLFAILFVGIIIFLMYGFNPHTEDKQWQTIENFAVMLSLMVFISVPLYSSLVDISEKIIIETEARKVITTSLTENIPKARLESLFITDFDDKSVEMLGTIKIPEAENFFSETRESIRQQLGQALGRNVNFSVEIIPIASIISREQEESEEKIPREREIRSTIEKYLSENFPEAIIIDLSVGEIELGNTNQWATKIIFSLTAGKDFTEDLKIKYEKEINRLFPSDQIDLIWVFLQNGDAPTVASQTDAQKHHEKLSLEWDNFFKKNLPAECSTKNLHITWNFPDDEQLQTNKDFTKIKTYSISFDLYTPKANQVQIARFKRLAKIFAKNLHKKPTSLNIRSFSFDLETISTSNEDER
ncbi:MAG: TIGR00341 family protein [Candidatus Gracilibacteria bacterium]|nr:TIGR00341 family protein [Candidatus Gracilibacteria bacterium]